MRRSWLLLAPLLALIVFTGTAVALLVAHERSVSQSERQRVAVQEAAEVRQRFESTVSRLSTTSGLFVASKEVGGREFLRFAQTLLTEPTLDNVAFIQAVNADGRPELERRFGLPVTDRLGRGSQPSPPSPRRAEYFPYTLPGTPLKEPRTGLLDAGSEPERAATLRRARDLGRPRATAAVKTFGDGRAALLVYAPVYFAAKVPRTRLERRTRLRGFAAGVLGLDHMLAPDQRGRVQVLQDGRRISGARRLEDATGAAVVLAGRRLTIRVHTGIDPTYTSAIAVAAGGLVLVLALGIVLVGLTRREAYAQGLVARRLAERRELEEELRRMAVEDALTGLPNRRGLHERLDAELSLSRRYGGGALVLLDLDEFKEINDSRGHSAGDEVLKRVAELLVVRLRESDHVARLGGDEFALVLPRVEASGACSVADEIREALRCDRRLTQLYGRPVTASLGVAVMSDGPDLDAERLLARADAAMYRAKRAGRDRTAVYDDEPSMGASPV